MISDETAKDGHHMAAEQLLSGQEDFGDVDERSLFDDAVADTPPQREEQPVEQRAEQPAAETPAAPAAVAPQGEQPVEQPQDHRIPLRELLDEREKRQRAERQAEERDRETRELRQRLDSLERQRMQAEQRQQQPMIDPLADPEGFAAAVQRQARENYVSMRLESTFADAHDEHGEKFEKAYDALTRAYQSGDTTTRDRIVNAPNPGKALMRWHGQQEALRTVGTDPNAWLEKQLEERLKDPAFLARAAEAARGLAAQPQPGARPQTAVQIPASLSSLPAARGGGEEAMPETERELWDSTSARR